MKITGKFDIKLLCYIFIVETIANTYLKSSNQGRMCPYFRRVIIVYISSSRLPSITNDYGSRPFVTFSLMIFEANTRLAVFVFSFVY